MAVASVSGHFSSSRSVVSSFLTGFFPIGWSPLQRRHTDPVPQQGLAECKKTFDGAHPLFAERQLHVPAAVLQPPPCLPGWEESGTSQVPVRYASFSWDQSRIFQSWDLPSCSAGGSKLRGFGVQACGMPLQTPSTAYKVQALKENPFPLKFLAMWQWAVGLAQRWLSPCLVPWRLQSI